MFVISKKRLEIILGMVVLSVFAVLIVNNENIQSNMEVKETVALPVTNKVIVIDAGHGVPDEGAQSRNRNNRS